MVSISEALGRQALSMVSRILEREYLPFSILFDIVHISRVGFASDLAKPQGSTDKER